MYFPDRYQEFLSQQRFAKNLSFLLLTCRPVRNMLNFASLHIRGSQCHSSVFILIQIYREGRGVWFPLNGLMTLICFATVWLSSILKPPERFWLDKHRKEKTNPDKDCSQSRPCLKVNLRKKKSPLELTLLAANTVLHRFTFFKLFILYIILRHVWIMLWSSSKTVCKFSKALPYRRLLQLFYGVYMSLWFKPSSAPMTFTVVNFVKSLVRVHIYFLRIGHNLQRLCRIIYWCSCHEVKASVQVIHFCLAFLQLYFLLSTIN